MAVNIKWNKNVSVQVKEAALAGLKEAGERVLEASNQKVPVESGELKRSGRVTPQGDIVVISYDTAYALRQHEDTSLRHERGEAKFLESAMKEQADAVTNIIADAIKAEIGG